MQKSQSAMEYLMTYGWAILIIAVVLSVLFQLGVFSSGNFQPHAQAGSCQVSRTAAGVSLEGQCNGLQPQFVASINGATGNILAVDPSLPSGSAARTLTVWFKVNTNGDYRSGVGWGQGCSSGSPGTINYLTGPFNNGQLYFMASYDDVSPSNQQISPGTWYFEAFSYSGSTTINLYLDSNEITAGLVDALNTQAGSPLVIGQSPCGYWAGGYMANIQVYNTSLSSSEIQALYLEGIGGAPIRPQNLVGWWPLNGNTNDYSGNDYNGQIYGSGIDYSSTWTGGYAAP